MSVCASGALTSQVPRLRSTGYSFIPSISPPPLPHTGINIEPLLRSQLQLRGCINSSPMTFLFSLAEVWPNPPPLALISPPYTHASNGSVPPRSCLYNPPLPLGFFSTHQLSTSIPSLSFIKKHHQPSMTAHFTPAQRAEVHAALNELNRVYTEHQAAAAPATNTNHEQQPNPPVNESPDNSVESETDQLASSESGSNATPVPPTPVLQPANIPVLTANHATIAPNPPPAYNPIPTIQQRIAEHNQIFDQQVEEIIDPNVDLELQVAFTLVDLRQMMYLVTTDFATYCNAFPAGFRERQARVRVLRAYQDHLNLFVQLARL
ncbi:hypothetical protein MJO28_015940 [Puccinia striiformis f. sp. tritici]|uniref:Uncharacterized protein n=1 Tax=Puccinia striiformis f. sp. tritici TaxID=168172 RepID=A0ACC0DS43_9BASI|nr:hypothetical protein MJO28_015940 [Puccinia striiformis f. sp. tritici]